MSLPAASDNVISDHDCPIVDKPISNVLAVAPYQQVSPSNCCSLLPLLARLSSLSIVPSDTLETVSVRQVDSSSQCQRQPAECQAWQNQRFAHAARPESDAALTVAAFCSRRHQPQQQQQRAAASDPLRRITKPPQLLRRPAKRRQQQHLQHCLHSHLSLEHRCSSATTTILVSAAAITELLLSNQHLAQLSFEWLRSRGLSLLGGIHSPPVRLALTAPPSASPVPTSAPSPQVASASSSSSLPTSSATVLNASSSIEAPTLMTNSNSSVAIIEEVCSASADRCRLAGDAYADLTVYELASYFDELVRLPKKMSSQAESMYL